MSSETFSDLGKTSELNPRTKCDILKDSVYGYIRFTHNPAGNEATEKDLIDSPWVQRLRRIKQLQAAWYVYPSADHSRSIHSLSVTELAGRFARAVYEPFWRQHHSSSDLRLPSPALAVETLRIAGLMQGRVLLQTTRPPCLKLPSYIPQGISCSIVYDVRVVQTKHHKRLEIPARCRKEMTN